MDVREQSAGRHPATSVPVAPPSRSIDDMLSFNEMLVSTVMDGPINGSVCAVSPESMATEVAARVCEKLGGDLRPQLEQLRLRMAAAEDVLATAGMPAKAVHPEYKVAEVVSMRVVKGKPAKGFFLVELDVGEEDPIHVVTNLKGVVPGGKVAVAPRGSTVMGRSVEVTEICGEESHGVLCSSRDIGWPGDGSEVFSINAECKPGDAVPLEKDVPTFAGIAEQLVAEQAFEVTEVKVAEDAVAACADPGAAVVDAKDDAHVPTAFSNGTIDRDSGGGDDGEQWSHRLSARKKEKFKTSHSVASTTKAARKKGIRARLHGLESLLGGESASLGGGGRGGSLAGFVTGNNFEFLSMLTVCAFCLVTALELQAEGLRLGHQIGYGDSLKYNDISGTGWDVMGDVLYWVSLALGCLFVMELGLRVAGLRAQFFKDLWNYVDIVILVGWIFEITGLQAAGSPRLLRPIRLVRLLRFIKMVKYIRRLEALYFIARALSGSLRIFYWSCVFLFSLQGLTAFVFTELLNTFYFGQGNDVEDEKLVFEYFGSFVRSLLTTFEMAMGNWPVPARILFENVSEWFIVASLIHKLFVGFAVIAVINSVFVQETFQVAMTDDLAMVLKKEKTITTTVRKLQTLFQAADKDGDAKVDLNEFNQILQNKDIRLWLASLEFEASSPEDVRCLFELLDDDGSGALSCEEFVQGMLRLRGGAKEMDLLALRDIMIREINMQHSIAEDVKKQLSTRSEIKKNPPPTR